jgi:outer membrane receptor protein involved in Fe transport
MHRHESGAIADLLGNPIADDYRATSSGWYLQSVYQFAPRWRVGARYDSLAGRCTELLVRAAGSSRRQPDRLSLMLDWNPSEFSRLRAQYDWDHARDDGRYGSHLAPAIHLRHRRARRAQVLGTPS